MFIGHLRTKRKELYGINVLPDENSTKHPYYDLFEGIIIAPGYPTSYPKEIRIFKMVRDKKGYHMDGEEITIPIEECITDSCSGKECVSTLKQKVESSFPEQHNKIGMLANLAAFLMGKDGITE